MKTTRPMFLSLTDWVSATWPHLAGRQNSLKIPKAAQAAADQQWEGEGGSIKPAKAAPAPAAKLPL